MLALLLLLQDLPGAVPLPRDSGWLRRHEAFVAEAKKGDVDLLFLGDSLTEAWRGQKELWTSEFGSCRAANFGLAGDGTQHLLWRLRNGTLDGLRPRAIVLLIGTNNLGRAGESVESARTGVEAILKELRSRAPGARVLLLGVLPRGETAAHPLREKIRALNAELATLEGLRFVDFGGRLLRPDGTLSPDLLPDGMHLSTAGYRIWAEALREPLAELLK